MLRAYKESGDYLNQIRNNIPEKVEAIEQEIGQETLPASRDGKIRIIELGLGGGESLKELQKKTTQDNVELVGVDILPTLASSLKKQLNTETLAADGGSLPFQNESISAINASAILHEVSSYGTGTRQEGGRLYGKAAIQQAFGEFNRTLLPQGVLAYRDVFAPLYDVTEETTVNYQRKIWGEFAQWFLRDFSDANFHFYDGTNITPQDNGSGISLTAPRGVQREFQRHYLMLRDYLRNVRADAFGMRIMRSDWIDQEKGLKLITFSLDEKLAPMLELEKFEKHDSATGTVFRADSDVFDTAYDDLMEFYFREMRAGSPQGKKFEEAIEAWKQREGLEHYIYGNIGGLLEFGAASGPTGNDFVLFPESAASIQIAARDYYNRYLRQQIDHPEFDGKQIIKFRKISKAQARKVLETELTDSDLISSECFARLQTILSA